MSRFITRTDIAPVKTQRTFSPAVVVILITNSDFELLKKQTT